MDLIVRFIREGSLPNAKGSSISPERVDGSDAPYLVAWSTSEEEMASLPDSSGWSVLLPSWSGHSSPAEPDADLLWNLLPSDARKTIENAPDPVQLFLESGNPAVDLLPWESLASKNPIGSRLTVARLVPYSLQPPPLTVIPPLRMLLVTSNADDDLAFSDRDGAVLRSAAAPESYVVREVKNATGTSVMATVRDFDPHIVHFMGHGGLVSGEAAVVLRDESTGLTDWVRASQASRGLPLSTRLLCISTGFSQRNFDIAGLVGFAHAPKTVRLPTCIVNRSTVDEPGVKCFWDAFYSALIERGGNVLAAYNTAIAELSTASTATPTSSFSLVVREGGFRPLKFGKTIDVKQYAAEVQAQLAARLAADLKDKLKTYADTEMGKALGESYAEERSRFSTFSSTAASFDTE